MSLDENKAVVRGYFDEVWNKGNLSVLGQYVTDDVRDYALGPNPTPGHDSVLAHHRVVSARLLDFHIEIEELVADGDVVVVFWTGTGISAATQMRVAAPAVSRLRVVGGKVAEYRVLSDRGNVQQPAEGRTASAPGA